MKSLFFKSLALVSALFSMSVIASAQISTGYSSAREINIGNRATAGTFGIYVAGVMQSDGDGINFDSPVISPILNFKYMAMDNKEYRLALKWCATGNTVLEDRSGYTGEEKTGKSEFILYPGVLWHLSNANILDVYAGLEGVIGREGYTVNMSQESNSTKTIKSQLDLGAGAVFGLQAYLGQLPFSIGLEYGLYANAELGKRFKNIVKDSNGMSTVTYGYNSYSTDYKELSNRDFKIFNQLRLTLCYYFGM